MGAEGLLTKLVRAGATYRKHASFVQKTLTVDESSRQRLLQDYVMGLSDASFAGFKVTLMLLANNERVDKKGILSLLRQADGVRSGTTSNTLIAASPAKDARIEIEPDFDLEELHTTEGQLLGELIGTRDEKLRMILLLDHVMALDQAKFGRFSQRLAAGRDHMAQRIRNHQRDEPRLCGNANPYAWQQTHRDLCHSLQNWEWLIEASEGAWEIVADRNGSVQGEAACRSPG